MLSFKSKNVFVIRSIKYRHVLVYRCWGLLFISRNKLTLVCIWSYCGESLVIFFLLRLFQENVIFHSDFMTRFVVRTDRKSTRLNSSHVKISYAVFCLKKKTPSTRCSTTSTSTTGCWCS